MASIIILFLIYLFCVSAQLSIGTLQFGSFETIVVGDSVDLDMHVCQLILELLIINNCLLFSSSQSVICIARN